MNKDKKVRFLERSTPPHIFTLILLASISALTMNIFLPSLPTIAADLNSSTSILGLSVGIYLASSAILQLIIGPFSDQFGRRPLILCSLIIFCLSTLATVFVTTAWASWYALHYFYLLCCFPITSVFLWSICLFGCRGMSWYFRRPSCKRVERKNSSSPLISTRCY